MKEGYKWLATVMFIIAAIVVIAAAIVFDVLKAPLTYDIGSAITALVLWLIAIGLMAFAAWKFGASLRSKISWFKHWKNASSFVLILIGILLIFFAIKFPFVYTYFVKVPEKGHVIEVVYTLIPLPETGVEKVVKDVSLITWEYYEVVAYRQVWIQTPLFLTGLVLIMIGLIIGYWSIYESNIKFEKELAEQTT